MNEGPFRTNVRVERPVRRFDLLRPVRQLGQAILRNTIFTGPLEGWDDALFSETGALVSFLSACAGALVGWLAGGLLWVLGFPFIPWACALWMAAITGTWSPLFWTAARSVMYLDDPDAEAWWRAKLGIDTVDVAKDER